MASCGWIIPEPFAIPPTTKPSPCATASFAYVSVVMIAVAASAPPCWESPAAAERTPATTLLSGSGVPITPVDRTSTSSVARSSRRAASAAVAYASSRPRSPVAAFATPEFVSTACGCASSRCSLQSTTGAASTRFAVNIPAPVAGTSERTSERSRRSFLRIPQCTPLATNPLAAVTPFRSDVGKADASATWRAPSSPRPLIPAPR